MACVHIAHDCVLGDNIIMAKEKSQPLCQNTGVIICYADLPAWLDEMTFRKAYEKAVVEATDRAGAVDEAMVAAEARSRSCSTCSRSLALRAPLLVTRS